MTTYSAEYVDRLQQSVDRFEIAFDRWMGTQTESDHWASRGLYPTVQRKADADEGLVRRLEIDVAEAAGEVARAVAVTGSHIAVAGVGAIDPIANWSLMSGPKPLVSPHDIRSCVATMRGRLRALLTEAEVTDQSGMPGFAPSELHPLIWSAAAAHWTTHQRRVAVREAAEALTVEWKARLGRNDVDDTVFWQQSLSPGEPSPGRPKIVWPGPRDDKTTKSMRGGLEPLAKALSSLATGLNLTIRNVTTHTRTELSEQEAMERLAAYSYFARLLDRCEVRTSPC